MSDLPTATIEPASIPFEGPPANPLVAVGRFFFKWRNAIFPVVFAFAAIAIKPRLFQGNLSDDLRLDIAGFSVALLGQVLRSITVGLEYIKRGGKKKRVYADHLVTGGVFAHCRNPLYVGNMLQVIGLVIIHNSPWMYLAIIPLFTLVYVSIVAAEEQFLTAKFGQAYADYCNRVSRWWITPTGWSHTFATARFDWLKLIRKEYGTPFSCITISLLLMAWESVRAVGLHSSHQRLVVISLIWAPLAFLWGATRVLKKQHLLGSD